jgi:hypothetical protein
VLADELEDEHALSMEFETPHTDWAQPYALGKTRVLFLSNGRGTKAREIVELMQRFDIEAEAIYWARIVDTTIDQWHGGEPAHRRIARLLEERWDCYILHEVKLSDLTLEEQYNLLVPVTEGAGIVFIGTDDERVLKDKNHLAELPPMLEGREVGEAYRVKQGRAIRLPARPKLDYHLGWEIEYDYWQERLGRAVLWAAGKEPEAGLEAAVQQAEITREDLPTVKAAASWEAPPGMDVDLELRLTRWDGLRIPLVSAAGQENAEFAEADLPALPAGEYHLDAFLRSKRGVENWVTTAFAVTTERKVAEVSLAQDWGEVGEELAGSARLEGEPGADERLAIRLRDRHNRILAQQELPAAEPVAAFSFPTEPWMPMLLRVEACLSDGKGDVSTAHAYYRITRRNRGQFNFLVWDYPKDTLAPYAEEALARLGMTVQLAGGNPPPEVAAFNVAWVPYTTRIMDPHDENGVMQPHCWNDEPAIDQYVQGIADNYAASRAHGVFAYSLGDETVTRGSCVHPACLNAYRAYLEQEYGDIAALNASWGSNYAGFAEVALMDPADNDAAAALRERNYPRWYDRQAFQCCNFVQFCTRFAGKYSELDPEARTGFEGAGRFDRGDDFDLIVRTNGFWSPYPGPGDEVIRSIADRDFPRANWMGYTKDADSLLSKYWRMVTRGMDSVWWWRWDNIGRFHGLLMPHLAPFPAIEEMMKDTQIVRDGLGDLLLHSEMQDDGIAVLYSLPSAYASRIEAGPSYGGYSGAHVAWHKAIRDLGLQFRYVTDRMMRLGEFDASRFRVLILPQAEALGPEEAEVIRDFVNRGGHVIADVRPGIYDGHCKPLEAGSLDELFGVARSGHAEAAPGGLAVKVGDGPELAVEKATVDPTVTLAGGESLGQVGEHPAFVTHDVGEGRAVLLNVGILSLPDISTPEAPEAAAELLASLFEAAGVTPQVRLTDTKGRRLRNVETVRWLNGNTEIVTLFRESGEQQKARVALSDRRYVYDLRNRGKGHTSTDSFATTIVPCRAAFFVLAERPVDTPSFGFSNGAAARGTVATLGLSAPDAVGLHAFRVGAILPDGTSAEWLDRVVLAGQEPEEIAVPVALNDPVGDWRFGATDLFTGKTFQVELAVK